MAEPLRQIYSGCLKIDERAHRGKGALVVTQTLQPNIIRRMLGGKGKHIFSGVEVNVETLYGTYTAPTHKN